MASRVRPRQLTALFGSLRVAEAEAGPSSRRSVSSAATKVQRRPTLYPYSSQVNVPKAVPFVSTKKEISPPPEPKSIYTGVMPGVHRDLRARFDPGNRFTKLFDRKSDETIPAGSVLVVETWTSMSKTNFSTFSGIVIAIRRRGVATSFVLRNLVQKLGVEMTFRIYSPLLKDIKVIQRATAGKNEKSGSLRRTRRAKLYYLRNDDRRLAGINSIIRVHRAREEQKAAAAAVRKGSRR